MLITMISAMDEEFWHCKAHILIISFTFKLLVKPTKMMAKKHSIIPILKFWMFLTRVNLVI